MILPSSTRPDVALAPMASTLSRMFFWDRSAVCAVGNVKSSCCWRAKTLLAAFAGDDFLIKAVDVGRADVAVRILARGYEHINQANMTLTIVDPFVIVAADDFFEGPTPFSPVSILPTSSFNYKLRYVKK